MEELRGKGGREKRGKGREEGKHFVPHPCVCPLKCHSSPRLGILHLQTPDFSVVEKTERVEGCKNPPSLIPPF